MPEGRDPDEILQETGDSLESPWENNSVTVPDYYVNRFLIDEGASDVSISLGNAYREVGHTRSICQARLTMTHDNFFQFAEEVAQEAEFLKTLYKGIQPSLRDATASEWAEAARKVYNHEPDEDAS